MELKVTTRGQGTDDPVWTNTGSAESSNSTTDSQLKGDSGLGSNFRGTDTEPRWKALLRASPDARRDPTEVIDNAPLSNLGDADGDTEMVDAEVIEAEGPEDRGESVPKPIPAPNKALEQVCVPPGEAPVEVAGEGDPQEPQKPQEEPLEPHQMVLQDFRTVAQTLSAAYGSASSNIQKVVRRSLRESTTDDWTFIFGASNAIRRWVEFVGPAMACTEMGKDAKETGKDANDPIQLLTDAWEAEKEAIDAVLGLIPEKEPRLPPPSSQRLMWTPFWAYPVTILMKPFGTFTPNSRTWSRSTCQVPIKPEYSLTPSCRSPVPSSTRWMRWPSTKSFLGAKSEGSNFCPKFWSIVLIEILPKVLFEVLIEILPKVLFEVLIEFLPKVFFKFWSNFYPNYCSKFWSNFSSNFYPKFCLKFWSNFCLKFCSMFWLKFLPNVLFEVLIKFLPKALFEVLIKFSPGFFLKFWLNFCPKFCLKFWSNFCPKSCSKFSFHFCPNFFSVLIEFLPKVLFEVLIKFLSKVLCEVLIEFLPKVLFEVLIKFLPKVLFKAQCVIWVLHSAEGQIIDARDFDYGRDWNIGLYDIVSMASTKKVEKNGQFLWKGHSVTGKVTYGYCPFCSYASTNHRTLNNHIRMHLHLSLACGMPGCWMVTHSAETMWKHAATHKLHTSEPIVVFKKK